MLLAFPTYRLENNSRKTEEDGYAMYDVKDFLERALRQQRNMLKIYEKNLQGLPEGNLGRKQTFGAGFQSAGTKAE